MKISGYVDGSMRRHDEMTKTAHANICLLLAARFVRILTRPVMKEMKKKS